MAIEPKFQVGEWVKNISGKYRFIEAYNKNNGECKIVYSYESAHAPGNFVQGSVWIHQDKLETADNEPDYIFWKNVYIELAFLANDKELFNKVMEANEAHEQEK
jgi:hypothetical protein